MIRSAGPERAATARRCIPADWHDPPPAQRPSPPWACSAGSPHQVIIIGRLGRPFQC